MSQHRQYQGRVVVITGGGGGLGAAFARAFAAQGATIALLDLDGAAAARVAAELSAQGHRAQGWACDVSDETACRGVCEDVCRTLGGVDVLVANAGISARCLARDTGSEVLRKVLAVNFFGAVWCTQALLPSIVERQGQILVTSSVAGFAPLVGRTAYAASKHALHGWFDSLRSELRASGVDVMLVCPSFVATGIEQAALGGDGRRLGAARATVGQEESADVVAARIVDAARRRQRLCLPSRTSWLAWWLSRLAPAAYERRMVAAVGADYGVS